MLRFGIEIEFMGSVSAVADAMHASELGFQDRRHTYQGFSTVDWVLKYDGSVDGSGRNGGELVSPPLDFDDPAQRNQVTTAILALQRAGVQPHSKAGIHVHVEASHEDGTKFSPREVAAIVRFFHKFQDIIYRIGSSGWLKAREGVSQYARPIDKLMAEKMMKVRNDDALVKAWYGTSSVSSNHYDDSRYRGVNLHCFFQQGTIEFRLFNSSVNPDRVQAYVALSCAIIRDVRNGYNRSVKKSYEIGGMASGATDEAAAMLRFQQIIRYESGMSKEDWQNLRRTCWNDSVPQSFARSPF